MEYTKQNTEYISKQNIKYTKQNIVFTMLFIPRFVLFIFIIILNTEKYNKYLNFKYFPNKIIAKILVIYK